MVTDPEKNFFLVLKFLELDFLIKKFKKKFLKALEMSSIENIKKIEKLYGRSINNSYVNSSNSQIINGNYILLLLYLIYFQGILALIIIRTLRRDIARYNMRDEEMVRQYTVHQEIFT